MCSLPRCIPTGLAAVLLPLLLACESPVVPAASSVAASRAQSTASGDLSEAVLFVGNLVPGVPAGNGTLRYDGTGSFIDHFTPGGCCMAFGADEHLYVNVMRGVNRFNGVTGEPMGVFVAPDPNPLVIAFIPLLGPDGYLYVSNRGPAQSIRRYAANGTVDDGFFVDGAAQGMRGGQFFAFGPDGHLYFTSGGTHEVLRFSSRDGAFIDRFVEPGEGGLVGPSGLTFGPDGTMYVGSPMTSRVLRFDRDGNYAGDFFPAGSGGLALPVGITFGPDGHFYVAGAATPQTAGVFRYDGTTGEFIDVFVGPGDGRATGPRSLEFKSRIAMCHVPPGSPDGRRTITVGYTSGRDHVEHGDDVGACIP